MKKFLLGLLISVLVCLPLNAIDLLNGEGAFNTTGNWFFMVDTDPTTTNSNGWYINNNNEMALGTSPSSNWICYSIPNLDLSATYQVEFDIIGNTDVGRIMKFSSLGIFGSQVINTTIGGTHVKVNYTCTSPNAYFKFGMLAGTSNVIIDNFTVQKQNLFFGAFPTVMGGGSNTRGAFGGPIAPVLILVDTYAEFKAACEATYPRIVQWRTGGVKDSGATAITDSNWQITIADPYITIAGQTASGEGVQLINSLIWIVTHDVIIRGLPVANTLPRTATTSGARNKVIQIADGAKSGDRYNIAIDHCNFTYGEDENVTFFTTTDDRDIYNVSLQYCIIANALGDHNYGSLVGSYSTESGDDTPIAGVARAWGISVHHNVFAHFRDRQPAIVIGEGFGDNQGNEVSVWNNIMYNGNWGFTYFIDHGGFIKSDIINNYYKEGGDSSSSILHITRGPASPYKFGPYSEVYIDGNVAYNQNGTSDTFREDISTAIPSPIKTSRTIDELNVNISSISDLIQELLISKNVGANYPTLESDADQVLDDVYNGTGAWKLTEPSWSRDSGTVATDTDSDGIPDDWEVLNGLNPNVYDSTTTFHDSGYSMWEIWANNLLDQFASSNYILSPDESTTPNSTRWCPFLNGTSDVISINVDANTKIDTGNMFTIAIKALPNINNDGGYIACATSYIAGEPAWYLRSEADNDIKFGWTRGDRVTAWVTFNVSVPYIVSPNTSLYDIVLLGDLTNGIVTLNINNGEQLSTQSISPNIGFNLDYDITIGTRTGGNSGALGWSGWVYNFELSPTVNWSQTDIYNFNTWDNLTPNSLTVYTLMDGYLTSPNHNIIDESNYSHTVLNQSTWVNHPNPDNLYNSEPQTEPTEEYPSFIFKTGTLVDFNSGTQISFLGKQTTFSGFIPTSSTPTEITTYTLVSTDNGLDNPSLWVLTVDPNDSIANSMWNVTHSTTIMYLQQNVTLYGGVTLNDTYVISYNVVENTLSPAGEFRLSSSGGFGAYTFTPAEEAVGSHRVTFNCTITTNTYELRVMVHDDVSDTGQFKISELGLYHVTTASVGGGSSELLGDNIVSNNYFTDGINGWNDSQGVFNGDTWVATANGSYFYLQQNDQYMISTPSIGEEYKLTIVVNQNTTNGTMGLSTAGAFGLQDIILTTGTNVFDVTVVNENTDYPVRFFIRSDNTSGYLEITEITLRKKL